MTIADNLVKLNKLRERDGQTPLKSWKKSGALLDEAIAELDKKLRPPPKPIPQADQPEKKQHPARMARGIGSDPYARHCRQSIQNAKAEEKRKKDALKDKKIKFSKADKKQIKDEAKKRNVTGRVDVDRDPAAAKRQVEHVKRKQEARSKRKAKPVDPNIVTAADIARDVGMTPKVARAKLRRHEDKLMKFKAPGKGRWDFVKKGRSVVEKILKGES